MTNWTKSDLERIGAADELHFATFKQDGTLCKPVILWAVCVGEELYVRAYRGREGVWFRQTQRRPEGRISASGVTKAVTFDALAVHLTQEEVNSLEEPYVPPSHRRASITDKARGLCRIPIVMVTTPAD